MREAMRIRTITTTTALSALLLLALAGTTRAQQGDQGPPPDLLLSNAHGYWVTATDKKQTGNGDPTEDYKDAIEYFNKYLKAAPGIAVTDSADIYSKIADSYTSMNMFAEAVPYYLWLIDRDPNPDLYPLSSNYLMAGYSIWQTKGLDEALPYYIKYVEMVPDDIPQRKVVAMSLRSQGKLDESLPHFLYLLDQTPEDQDVIDALLSIRTRLDSDYEKITLALAEKRPDTPQYLMDLGDYYLNRLDIDKAIEWLQKYAAKRPDDINGWAKLANAYRKKGDTQHALEALRKIKSMDPKHVQARAEIASIYLDQGNLNGAITELKGALALSPDDPQANLIMGNAAQQWGMQWLTQNYPDRSLEKMPYNLKEFLEKTVAKGYYAKARKDSRFATEAITQINYLSQFYPTDADRFMAPDSEKTPITFPPAD